MSGGQNVHDALTRRDVEQGVVDWSPVNRCSRPPTPGIAAVHHRSPAEGDRRTPTPSTKEGRSPEAASGDPAS